MAVARVTEIIASSPKGFEDAINEGLTRAAKTLRGITGIHVVSLKAAVEDGKITEYRAQMNITFILEG
ncbi:MAG: dodecin domain-containing protein [Candidatus Abyssubacteria bacterium]|nr:dodecin domain-containing protein [Candidatus Abyssubacteria bacterium]